MMLVKSLMWIKRQNLFIPTICVATPIWVALSLYGKYNGINNILLTDLYLLVVMIGSVVYMSQRYVYYRNLVVDKTTCISKIMSDMIEDYDTSKIVKIVLCIEIIEYSFYHYLIAKMLKDKDKNRLELFKKFID